MKGSPIRELILVSILGLLALWPLMRLTESKSPTVVDTEDAATSAELQQLESWVEILCSHPPKRLMVMQEGTVLLDSADNLREDLDALLKLREGVMQVNVVIEWPDHVQQAYVELLVEPGNLPGARAGAWGQGRQEELFELNWQGVR